MAKTAKYAGELELQKSTRNYYKNYHAYQGKMVVLYILKEVMPEAPKKVIVTIEGKENDNRK